MRTRTRSFIAPPGCTLNTPLNESFSDDASPARVWKPCTHTLTKCTAFSAPLVQQKVTRVGFPEGSFEIYPDASVFPHGGWNSGFFGGWSDEIFSDLSYPSLQPISLDSVAMDMSRSSTNLAEVIATYKDTLTMFKKPGAFLRHAKKQGIPVSRRPLKELKSALDRAGDTWLEGTYGYLPLISSLQELAGICKDPKSALRNLNKPLKKDIRDSASTVNVSKRDPATPWNNGTLHIEVSHQIKRLVRITGDTNPSFFATSIANQLATFLGLNDFGRLAWELTPYSFVFDWFSKVGSNMASCSALNGHVAYCNLSAASAIGTKTRTTYTTAPPTTTSYRYGSGYFVFDVAVNISPGSCVVESENFSRSSFGEADLSGSTFTTGLSSCRTASGLALLLGQMRRLPSW